MTMQAEKVPRDYYSECDLFFVHYGRAYSFTDTGQNVCFGPFAEILPYLKGEADMPEYLAIRERKTLAQLRDIARGEGFYGNFNRPGEVGVEGRGRIKATRVNKVTAGRFEKAQRVSVRLSEPAIKGVPVQGCFDFS